MLPFLDAGGVILELSRLSDPSSATRTLDAQSHNQRFRTVISDSGY